MFRYILADSGPVPRPLLEYRLKSHFHWTQAELEAESEQNIAYYINIMDFEQKRREQDSE